MSVSVIQWKGSKYLYPGFKRISVNRLAVSLIQAPQDHLENQPIFAIISFFFYKKYRLGWDNGGGYEHYFI
jgi:hypothetical protein